MTEAEIRQFVRTTVANALQLPERDIKDDTDFFSLGLDSLMAISIRRKLSQEVNTGGKVLGSNIVFEKPNVDVLTRFLYSLGHGIKEQERSVEGVVQSLVDKYSTFTQHIPGDVQMDGQYIVLTGATGSLGSFILATLIDRPAVKKVYCFVRARSQNAGQARVSAALERAHRLEALTEEQKAKIVVLPADMSQAKFGLEDEVYEKIRREVTNIIHCAWSVNFNMDVTSFEDQHIRGSWNLINLCLSSPHRTPAVFNFVSSISTVLGMKISTTTIPEVLPKLGDQMLMGYAQSKLVTEHICSIATVKTNIAARILRVGQIVGDTEYGMWNAIEATPLCIQSATTIGALPVIENGDEELQWIPVDTTAETIVDLSLLDRLEDEHFPARNAVLHVNHPKVLYWNRDVLPALKKAGLKFEAVFQREWVKRLEASEQDPAKNPPIKLVDFYNKKYGSGKGSEIYIETTEACKFSPSLREAKAVDDELVKRFLRYWQEKCW
jgi:thioester reductase-like protein